MENSVTAVQIFHARARGAGGTGSPGAAARKPRAESVRAARHAHGRIVQFLHHFCDSFIEAAGKSFIMKMTARAQRALRGDEAMRLIRLMRKRAAAMRTIAACLLRTRFAKKRAPRPGGELCALLAADLHTDGDPWRDRSNVLRRALSGMRAYAGDADALILAGDSTNTAHETEYRVLCRLLDVYWGEKDVVPQMGNHDGSGVSDVRDFDAACRRYLAFCAYCGIRADKTYYALRLKGYDFFVLGTERLLQDHAFLSDGQLRWLDDGLRRAALRGRPIFVVNHQPPKGRNDRGNPWEGASVGEQSQALERILLRHGRDAKHPIIYISGHLHQRLGQNTLERAADGLYYLNLPSLLSKEDLRAGGDGFVLTVGGGALTLQGVNFITGRQYADYRYDIPLDDSNDACAAADRGRKGFARV